MEPQRQEAMVMAQSDSQSWLGSAAVTALPLFYFVKLNPFSANNNVNVLLVSKMVTEEAAP